MTPRLRTAALTLLLAATLTPRAGFASDTSACTTAGADAERRQMLPPGLLLAIGQVESGRRDPVTGRVAPWPWTIDAAGNGQRFDDLPSALAATRQLLGKGVASIDIGCFQVNLAAHPDAFAGLEQAFDPAANADYASRFLVQLKQRLGSWEGAVAAYHSATPERGVPYRDMVMAAWGQPLPERGAASPRAPMSLPLPLPVIKVVTWSPAQGGLRVWLPSGNAAPNVIHLPAAAALPRVHTPAG
jgi:hypothetical protein